MSGSGDFGRDGDFRGGSSSWGVDYPLLVVRDGLAFVVTDGPGELLGLLGGNGDEFEWGGWELA